MLKIARIDENLLPSKNLDNNFFLSKTSEVRLCYADFPLHIVLRNDQLAIWGSKLSFIKYVGLVNYNLFNNYNIYRIWSNKVVIKNF